MSINVQLNGIIKFKKALERYPSTLREALIKANKETAEEYKKLVYHEFDSFQSAESFYQIVLQHFDSMIVSRTGTLRDSLKLLNVDGGYRVGWFNDYPDYAKYVILGTVHMLPRNPILEAIKTIELPERYLWQDEHSSQIGTVLPIMSRGFDDKAVATAYYKGLVYNLDSMIALKSGNMRNSLRIKRVGDSYRVGWFEDAPDYVKFVLMGTMYTLPRNPLIHAFDHEYLLQYMEKALKKELAKQKKAG